MAYAGLTLAVLAALLELASGPGSRLELWHFRTGMSLLKWGFCLAAAGFVICQVLVIHNWRTGKAVSRAALAGWILAFICVIVPLGMKRMALNVPVHNDYTTDPQDPPAFTVTPKPGPASAWPELEGKVLEAPEEEAFERALRIANDMGWEIVKADAKAGHIEAVATTAWFGFKDDVVIRVRPEKGMSRVDVRSASRVGKSDLGANARRIKAYMKRLGK
jgi:hypothetical protein